MSPRLSVVIPTHNCLAYLPAALRSVQTLPLDALEIIVVDDGSTDGTPDYLAAEAARDPRIVVIRRDRDHGASAARNAGIDRARAPVIGFLDADDIWDPAILDRLIRHEAEPGLSFSFSDYLTQMPGNRLIPRYTAYWPRFTRFIAGRHGFVALGTRSFSLLYGENPVCTSTVLASRAALIAVGGFDRGLSHGEDWDLWIRLAQWGPALYSARHELVRLWRDDSLSTKLAARNRGLITVVHRYRPYALRHAPGAALAASMMIAEARAEQYRAAARPGAACLAYLVAFCLQPAWRLGRETLRAGAVFLNLKTE